MVVVVGRRGPSRRTFEEPLGSSGVIGRRRKPLPEQPVTSADEGTAANDEHSKFEAGIHWAGRELGGVQSSGRLRAEYKIDVAVITDRKLRLTLEEERSTPPVCMSQSWRGQNRLPPSQ